MFNKFANYQLLWLLLIIPPFIYWEYKKENSSLKFSDISIPKQLKNKSYHWFEFIILILKILAIVCFIIALARPQKSIGQKEISRKGIDIIIALDASGSMAAEDLKENRLDAAKRIIQNFIKNRTNDRIGLIVFGERAIIKSPLTFDKEMLINIIEDIEIGYAGDGTAIGQAIVNSLNRIRDSQAKSKIIILVTDGENNAGNISPIEAAKLAKELQIKIYTIGIGSAEGAPIPFMHPTLGKQYARLPNGQLALTKLNPEELINIADITTGRYYQAKTNTQLKSIFQTIDKLEKIKIKTKLQFHYQEKFMVFILLGLIIMLIEFFLRNTVLQIFP